MLIVQWNCLLNCSIVPRETAVNLSIIFRTSLSARLRPVIFSPNMRGSTISHSTNIGSRLPSRHLVTHFENNSNLYQKYLQGWPPVLSAALGGQGRPPQDPGAAAGPRGAGPHHQHGRWHAAAPRRRARTPRGRADGRLKYFQTGEIYF